MFALAMLLPVNTFAMKGERYAVDGMEYYQRGEYRDAIAKFKLANNAADSTEPTYFFWLGRLYIAVNDIPSAYEWFNRYIDSGATEHRTEINQYLQILDRQTKIFSQFDVHNMPKYIYSWNSDYGAIMSPDQKYVYFTSLSPAKYEKENIWRAERFANGWGKPYLVESLSTDKNEALGSFSLDGKTAYLFGNFEKGKLDGDIYKSTFDGKKWSEPVNLLQVNSDQVDVHPYVYNDKWMFFSSSREGGFGGMDIWVSEFENGMWNTPVNLGPRVNTSGNEQTPFLDYDGRTLIFASDTHPGFGGYDLFKVVHLSDNWADWSIPENLGLPANSIRNDRYFYHSKDSNIGFISTDRKAQNFEKFVATNFTFTTPPSYLEKDPDTGEIISHDVIEDVPPEVVTTDGPKPGDVTSGDVPAVDKPAVVVPEPVVEILYAQVFGRVRDEDGTPIQTTIEFTTIVKKETRRITADTDSLGFYKINLPHADYYDVVVNEEGYNLYSTQLKPFDADHFLMIELRKLVEEKVFVLENVQFEFDKSRLTEASLEILNDTVITLLNNPGLKIEISGHTCNMGSAAYNQGLSERRAKSVYEYLISKGVEESRLSYKGYGLTQPMVSNEFLAGRIRNRRVEFKVKENK